MNHKLDPHNLCIALIIEPLPIRENNRWFSIDKIITCEYLPTNTQFRRFYKRRGSGCSRRCFFEYNIRWSLFSPPKYVIDFCIFFIKQALSPWGCGCIDTADRCQASSFPGEPVLIPLDRLFVHHAPLFFSTPHPRPSPPPAPPSILPHTPSVGPVPCSTQDAASATLTVRVVFLAWILQFFPYIVFSLNDIVIFRKKKQALILGF